MSASRTFTPTPGDPDTGVARFLAQFSMTHRAEALHLALLTLRARVEPERVLACELAWEVHARGYWSALKRADGTPYETEETYFRDVLGLASWRTAYKRLAIGRMLMTFGEAERSLLRAALADVGLAKATVVAPAIERLGAWRDWVSWACRVSTVQLQARVSEALNALPRGREPDRPGERFRRTVLAAMPDIEAMELVERFFELGADVVGTDHAIAIFLAGCRECLPEWELQATQRWRPRRTEDEGPLNDRETSSERADGICASRSRPRAREFCPRGQNGGAPPC